MSGVPVVFAKLLELSELLGVRSIKDLPGCWEPELARSWRVAVNGHREKTAASWGPDVPPFHALFEQPEIVGALLLVSPGGGTGLGAGVEDECIAVVDEAVARARGQGTLFPEADHG